jgi:hypothetical protein
VIIKPFISFLLIFRFRNKEKELTVSCLEESEAYNCGLLHSRDVLEEFFPLFQSTSLPVFYQANGETYGRDFQIVQQLYPSISMGLVSLSFLFSFNLFTTYFNLYKMSFIGVFVYL